MNAEARLRQVFEFAYADGTTYRHPNAPIVVAEVKGRCVRVMLSGSPRWDELAEDLLGNGNPCEEFRLEGQSLYARIKAPEQFAADAAAADFDEAHGELRTHGFPDSNATPAKTKAGKPAKERKRGPLYTAIADHIKASGESSFMRRDLLADVKEALERDGRDVRADNLARALDTQIVGTLLDVVPDSEGEELTIRDE